MGLQNYRKMLIWPKKEEHYKKVENYGLKKYKTFDSIYRNGKDDKIWWCWNPKTKIAPT